MSLIRVRDKNQITLPREVMEAMHVQSPGYLQYTILRDGVLLQAASSSPRDPLSKIHRLSQSVQSAYGGTLKADEFVSLRRDEWAK